MTTAVDSKGKTISQGDTVQAGKSSGQVSAVNGNAVLVKVPGKGSQTYQASQVTVTKPVSMSAPQPPITPAGRAKVKTKNLGDPKTGGFPVRNQSDLDRAVQAIGRASDPELVKQRLVKIAKQRGLKLPDSWADKPGVTDMMVKASTGANWKLLTINTPSLEQAQSIVSQVRAKNSPSVTASEIGGGVVTISYDMNDKSIANYISGLQSLAKKLKAPGAKAPTNKDKLMNHTMSASSAPVNKSPMNPAPPKVPEHNSLSLTMMTPHHAQKLAASLLPHTKKLTVEGTTVKADYDHANGVAVMNAAAKAHAQQPQVPAVTQLGTQQATVQPQPKIGLSHLGVIAASMLKTKLSNK